MKELSIEEKARAYDEAIKYAHYLINERCKENTDGSFHRADLNKMFPELAESEDERIIGVFRDFAENFLFWEKHELTKEKALDWLEKQGEKGTNGNEREIPNSEQNHTDKFPKYDKGDILTDGKNKYKVLSWDYTETGIAAYYMESDGCKFSWNCEEADKKLYIVEQKPTDKIEPKFHEGDWIITNKNHIWYVDETPETTSYLYRLINQYGKVEVAEFEIVDKKARLWTIQDAKDGDVLYCKSGDIEYIVMSKGINERGNIDSYFRYNSLHGFGVDIPSVLSTRKDNITPATKEQRDLLFQKMHEAGYEWDAEKKELKKIEHNPAWSEEDEKMMQYVIGSIDTNISDSNFKNIRSWFETIKERVQAQPKQEWSERDKEEFHIAIETLAEAGQNDSAHWLKFLKERHTWKPSDEQMENLSRAVNGESYRFSLLTELYQDLKKLSREVFI